MNIMNIFRAGSISPIAIPNIIRQHEIHPFLSFKPLAASLKLPHFSAPLHQIISANSIFRISVLQGRGGRRQLGGAPRPGARVARSPVRHERLGGARMAGPGSLGQGGPAQAGVPRRGVVRWPLRGGHRRLEGRRAEEVGQPGAARALVLQERAHQGPGSRRLVSIQPERAAFASLAGCFVRLQEIKLSVFFSIDPPWLWSH